MHGITRFNANGNTFDIPETEAPNFLKDAPDAQRTRRFTAGGNTYDIPDGEAEAFLKDAPDAVETRTIGYRGADGTDKTVDVPLSDMPKFLRENYNSDDEFAHDRERTREDIEANMPKPDESPIWSGVKAFGEGLVRSVTDSANLWRETYGDGPVTDALLGANANANKVVKGILGIPEDIESVASMALGGENTAAGKWLKEDAKAGRAYLEENFPSRISEAVGREDWGTIAGDKIGDISATIIKFAAGDKDPTKLFNTLVVSSAAADSYAQTYDNAIAHGKSVEDANYLANGSAVWNALLTMFLMRAFKGETAAVQRELGNSAKEIVKREAKHMASTGNVMGVQAAGNKAIETNTEGRNVTAKELATAYVEGMGEGALFHGMNMLGAQISEYGHNAERRAEWVNEFRDHIINSQSDREIYLNTPMGDPMRAICESVQNGTLPDRKAFVSAGIPKELCKTEAQRREIAQKFIDTIGITADAQNVLDIANMMSDADPIAMNAYREWRDVVAANTVQNDVRLWNGKKIVAERVDMGDGRYGYDIYHDAGDGTRKLITTSDEPLLLDAYADARADMNRYFGIEEPKRSATTFTAEPRKFREEIEDTIRQKREEQAKEAKNEEQTDNDPQAVDKPVSGEPAPAEAGRRDEGVAAGDGADAASPRGTAEAVKTITNETPFERAYRQYGDTGVDENGLRVSLDDVRYALRDNLDSIKDKELRSKAEKILSDYDADYEEYLADGKRDFTNPDENFENAFQGLLEDMKRSTPAPSAEATLERGAQDAPETVKPTAKKRPGNVAETAEEPIVSTPEKKSAVAEPVAQEPSKTAAEPSVAEPVKAAEPTAPAKHVAPKEQPKALAAANAEAKTADARRAARMETAALEDEIVNLESIGNLSKKRQRQLDAYKAELAKRTDADKAAKAEAFNAPAFEVGANGEKVAIGPKAQKTPEQIEAFRKKVESHLRDFLHLTDKDIPKYADEAVEKFKAGGERKRLTYTDILNGEEATPVVEAAFDVRDKQSNLYKVEFSPASKKAKESARERFKESVDAFKKAISDPSVSLEELKREAAVFDAKEKEFDTDDRHYSQHHDWEIGNAIRAEIARREGTEAPLERDEFHPQGRKPEDPWMASVREDKNAILLNKRYGKAKTDGERKAIKNEFDKLVEKHKAEWEKQNVKAEPAAEPAPVAPKRRPGKKFAESAPVGSQFLKQQYEQYKDMYTSGKQIDAKNPFAKEARGMQDDILLQRWSDESGSVSAEMKRACANEIVARIAKMETSSKKTEEFIPTESDYKAPTDETPLPRYEADAADELGAANREVNRRVDEYQDWLEKRSPRKNGEITKDKRREIDRKLNDYRLRMEKEIVDPIRDREERAAEEYDDFHGEVSYSQLNPSGNREIDSLNDDINKTAHTMFKNGETVPVEVDAKGVDFKKLSPTDNKHLNSLIKKVNDPIGDILLFEQKGEERAESMARYDAARKDLDGFLESARKYQALKRDADGRPMLSRRGPTVDAAKLEDPAFREWSANRGTKADDAEALARDRVAYDLDQATDAAKRTSNWLGVKVVRETNADAMPEGAKASIVTDDGILAQFDNPDGTVTLYRAVKVGPDGSIRPPQSSQIVGPDGKYVDRPAEGYIQPDGRITVNKDGTGGAPTHMAEERPDLAKTKMNASGTDIIRFTEQDVKDGKCTPDMVGQPKHYFDLKKGKVFDPKTGERMKDGGSTDDVLYDPYGHTSNTPFNDQFSSAWRRPDWMVIRVKVLKSDLESGYRAEKAGLAVGPHPWNGGSVDNQLPPELKRKVFLHRYWQLERLVSDSEAADILDKKWGHLKDTLEIPDNRVTPGMREEMRKRGFKIVKTGNVKYLKGANGQVVGWYDPSTKEVHLKPGADAKTVAHEVGWHATYDWAKANHPTLAKTMEQYAANAPEALKSEIRKLYGRDLTPAELIEEIGAGRFEREHGKKLQKLLADRANRTWYRKVWDGIKDAYKAVLTKLGFNRVDLDEALKDKTPEQAMDFLASAMARGKTIGKMRPGKARDGARPMAAVTPTPSPSGTGYTVDPHTKLNRRERWLRQMKYHNIALRTFDEHIGRWVDGRPTDDSLFMHRINQEGLKKAAMDRSDFYENAIGKLMKEHGFGVPEVDAYLHYIGSPERNALILRREGKQNGSGESDQHWADAWNAVETKYGPKAQYIKQAAHIAWAMQEEGHASRKDSGRESQEQYDTLKQNEPHHIPHKKDLSELDPELYSTSGGKGIRRNEFMTAHGTDGSDSPLVFMFREFRDAKLGSIENEWRIRLADAVRQNPDIGTVYDATRGDGRFLRILDNHGNTVKENVYEMHHEKDGGDPNLIIFKEGGELKAIELNGDFGADIADAVTGRSIADFKPTGLQSAVKKVSRLYANTATSWSPTFGFGNFVKDKVEVGLHNVGDFGFGRLAYIPKGLAESATDMTGTSSMMRELGRYQKTRAFDTTTADGRLLKEFVEAGGQIGGAASEGFQDTLKRFDRFNLATPTGKAQKMWEVFKDFNERMEMINRLRNFETARKQGMSPAQAAFKSRQDSTDFNAFGRQKWMNTVWNFSNSVTGGTLASMVRVAKGASSLRVLGTCAAIGVMEALIEYALNGNEEKEELEGKSTGKDMSEYERANAIAVRNGEYFFRIPIHAGPYSIIKYAFNGATRVALGMMDANEYAKNLASEIRDTAKHFTGTGDVAGGDEEDLPILNLIGAPDMGQSFAPSMLQPVVQIKEKKTFSGAPMESYKQPNDPEPKSWNGRKDTEVGYKWMAQAQNAIGGGDKHLKGGAGGSADTSPEVFKAAFEGVFKNTGKDVMQTFDVLKNLATGHMPEIRNVPVVNRFVRKVKPNDRRYYETLKKYNAIVNKATKEEDGPEARRWVRKHPSGFFMLDENGARQRTELDRLVQQVEFYKKMSNGYNPVMTGETTESGLPQVARWDPVELTRDQQERVDAALHKAQAAFIVAFRRIEETAKVQKK